jgi:hypothetical protein
LDVIGSFVYVGREQLSVPASISPYNNPVIESVKDQERIVRNLTAFQILQNYFLVSQRIEYRARVLDTILSNYAANYLNFLLLQQLHTLAHFIEAFETLEFELKVRKPRKKNFFKI